MSVDPASYFSLTYGEAVEKFVAAADRRGLPQWRFANPRKGPAGEPLETLVTEMGAPDAENVLILNTGVHGTEALVGAGILTGMLSRPEAAPFDPATTRIVMVHILNPYGAAWKRYVNEDNVDLMKNLVYGDRWTPPDPLFIEFDDLIDLEHLDVVGADVARSRRADFLKRHGMDRLMASLKKGQSDRPKSICYNGRGATWSKITLDHILKEHAGGAANVAFIDLHSGVGDYGEAHVIVGGDLASQGRVRRLLGEDAHDTDLVTDTPVYVTQGAMLPGATFTAMTMEAGTVEFGEEFRALMWREMHDHIYGDPLGPAAQAVSERFRRFYYPISDDWRRQWWINATAMISRVSAALPQWRTDPT
jgi:hypothetical protein